MAFVKSGWLLRQSTILRRWKKNWFDLWSDGRLIFYDDQNRHDIEDKIHMRIHCINLRVGNECRDFQPPEGKQRDCLLQIVCRDGKTVNLCAESADDCLAWKIALQDARTNTDLMANPLQTMSSFESVTVTAMEILHWGCLLEQRPEWLWDHYSGSSRLPVPYLCSSKNLYLCNNILAMLSTVKL
ncbi:pleckstrin homology domain-containing family B member 2 isoform X2 [Egretta garzetta]|uniref:pleckstrin homology domain-containing family B member 2 isoform X2 n=1 Tax=Egretta garzetta TaxID=188379 RepID=UPI00163CDFB6|nr:pleckstrin homology domain-containing family B member 2 isoform X2 [Egretta garzetta]